jgi:hypothetical protein
MLRVRSWSWLTLFVCCLVVFEATVAGQAGGPVGLRVAVTVGNGAKNTIEQVPPEPITVIVTDRNNRPIQGSAVILTAPPRGPSGEFADGSNTTRLMTNRDGLVTVNQYLPNRVTGDYEIMVRAEFNGEGATATMQQSNIKPKKSHAKMLAIVGIGAAAVGAAVVAGHRGGGNSGSSSSSGNAPTISFGGSSVGGPR